MPTADVHTNETATRLVLTCPYCGGTTVITTSRRALATWDEGRGGPVHELFAELSYTQQCALETGGWHPDCWDMAAPPSRGFDEAYGL